MLLELFFPNFDAVAIGAGVAALFVLSWMCNLQDAIMPLACMGTIIYLLLVD